MTPCPKLLITANSHVFLFYKPCTFLKITFLMLGTITNFSISHIVGENLWKYFNAEKFYKLELLLKVLYQKLIIFTDKINVSFVLFLRQGEIRCVPMYCVLRHLRIFAQTFLFYVIDRKIPLSTKVTHSPFMESKRGDYFKHYLLKYYSWSVLCIEPAKYDSFFNLFWLL